MNLPSFHLLGCLTTPQTKLEAANIAALALDLALRLLFVDPFTCRTTLGSIRKARQTNSFLLEIPVKEEQTPKILKPPEDNT